MTPDAQRIAIAEACGWKLRKWESRGKTYQGWCSPEGIQCALLPDYPNDLNAMHEAEMMLFLTHNQVGCTLYFDWLSKLTAISAYPNEFYACRASAAKRAEAFLRTLNLWDDSK